jgi:hypothetical protein
MPRYNQPVPQIPQQIALTLYFTLYYKKKWERHQSGSTRITGTQELDNSPARILKY